MIQLQAQTRRSFIPSLDFSLSKAFYEALGCTLEWSQPHLALFKLADAHFYLQDHYAKEWADNCMFHIEVQDAAHCFEQISTLIESGPFSSALVLPPKQ